MLILAMSGRITDVRLHILPPGINVSTKIRKQITIHSRKQISANPQNSLTPDNNPLDVAASDDPLSSAELWKT